VRNFHRWCTSQGSLGRRIAVDLFCGAGGLSLGLERAGWTVAAAVDHEPRALETHRHNFPGLALDLDLADEGARDTFVSLCEDISVDLVAGGPPCQPFSRAGSSKIRSLVDAGLREERDHRRELWSAFLDVALRLKPRAILMENVPDMGLGDDFAIVRLMVDRLEERGYATQVLLVDAWRFGVPQLRKRLIFLARSDGWDFSWPAEQQSHTTVRQSIADLPPLEGTTGAREVTYVPPVDPSPFSCRMREEATIGVLHDHMTRPVRADDFEIFRMMDSKTLYSEVPTRLRRYKVESFDDKYKRLGWDDLSRSITAHIAKDGYWYIHPEEHRTLTVREAARIQTFPDNFRFAGTRSDAFRLIGNAVPPLLSEAAAVALQQEPHSSPTARTDWLEVRMTLASWAKEQRSSIYWYMLPGKAVTPPVALAVAVTAGTRTDFAQLGTALKYLRGMAALNLSRLKAAKLCLKNSKAVDALDRLAPLIRKRSIWSTPERLPDALKLKPAERDLFDLLRGTDLLLRSQGPLRVASRVMGSNSAAVNRLTDGRLDLARLIGSGKDAPLRMAGLRLLSLTHCKADECRCTDCPLSMWCRSKSPQPAVSRRGSTAEVRARATIHPVQSRNHPTLPAPSHPDGPGQGPRQQ
jgi:DNA (cytosine-5)-methyltransferase 1